MNSTPQNKTPELRFPEFTGEWVEARIGQHLVERREKSTIKDQHSMMTSSNKGLMFQDEYYGENRITDRDNLGFNVIPPNFITYRSRSDTRQFTFNINELNETGLISIYYPVFSAKEMSDRFLVELLNNRKHYVGKYSVGTSQTVLSYNELCRLKLVLPDSPEQKKIASFLSAVDGRMAGLEKKGALLRDYKKGLMQQLFNQSLRFKDDQGNPFPDWVEKKFSMLAERAKEKLDPTTGENCLCVELESLSQETGALIKTLDSENLKSLKTRFVSGDVLFGKLRPYLKKFLLTNFDGVCSSEIWVLRGLAVSNEFLYFLIQTQKFSDEVNSTTGSKMPRAEWKYIAGVKFEIPSLAEQQKIAECLSAVDRRIGEVEAQVAQTRAFKQGLLQRMFI